MNLIVNELAPRQALNILGSWKCPNEFPPIQAPAHSARDTWPIYCIPKLGFFAQVAVASLIAWVIRLLVMYDPIKLRKWGRYTNNEKRMFRSLVRVYVLIQVGAWARARDCTAYPGEINGGKNVPVVLHGGMKIRRCVLAVMVARTL